MNVKKIWSNLAVAYLTRTNEFYTQLGFKPNGAHNSDVLTSFFAGEGNFVMHFFVKHHLEEALKGNLANSHQANEILFTIGADSRNDVDQWAKEVQTAGGTLISQPEEFGEGYYGFVFADPDGHKFNVFFM